MLYHFPLVFPGGVSPHSEFSVHLLRGHGLQVYQTLRLVRFGDEVAQPTGHGSSENLFGSKVKNLRLPCSSIKDFFLLYRYWWNTRIFPFTKKLYLHRAQWRYFFYLSRVRILVSPWLLTYGYEFNLLVLKVSLTRSLRSLVRDTSSTRR